MCWEECSEAEVRPGACKGNDASLKVGPPPLLVDQRDDPESWEIEAEKGGFMQTLLSLPSL